MVKIVSKNLSDNYNQKVLGHAKNSVTDAYKTDSKWAIQKPAAAEVTGDLIAYKIADRITKTSKILQKNIQKHLHFYIYISIYFCIYIYIYIYIHTYIHMQYNI